MLFIAVFLASKRTFPCNGKGVFVYLRLAVNYYVRQQLQFQMTKSQKEKNKTIYIMNKNLNKSILMNKIKLICSFLLAMVPILLVGQSSMSGSDVKKETNYESSNAIDKAWNTLNAEEAKLLRLPRTKETAERLDKINAKRARLSGKTKLRKNAGPTKPRENSTPEKRDPVTGKEYVRKQPSQKAVKGLEKQKNY